MAGGRSSVIIPIIILLTFKSGGGGDDRKEGAEEGKEKMLAHMKKNPKTPNISASHDTTRTQRNVPSCSKAVQKLLPECELTN